MSIIRAIVGDMPGAPLDIGQTYYIRGDRWDYVGRVKSVGPEYLVLEDASWVADTDPVGKLLNEGPGSHWQSERYPDPITIPLHRICDFTPWRHKLPERSLP